MEVQIILGVFVSWYLLVFSVYRDKMQMEPSNLPYIFAWFRYEFFPPYDRRLAIAIIQDRRRGQISSLLKSAKFSAMGSVRVAEAALFWRVNPRDVVSSSQSIPLADEILMHKLAHAHSVIEAQEFQLALAHIRSAGVVSEGQTAGLASAMCQFKPYLGIAHPHEMRYVIHWWLEGDGRQRPSRSAIREIKYAIRNFKPVELSYCDQGALPRAGSILTVENREDSSLREDVELNVLDVGSNGETPIAASRMVEGLEILFRRLGPPPESSTLEPSVSSPGGGGYGGR
ncbi:hypothetical protein [Streptomyces sp. NBC_00334]|uniref:hypothetical protein n=1 Tax=Streptomyces sp. NBC_00334 TaxID=2975713 RepID=UPI002E2D505F|nr:hypothetical protein [Streptomyces sp. NBC_00334]